MESHRIPGRGLQGGLVGRPYILPPKEQPLQPPPQVIAGRAPQQRGQRPTMGSETR